MKKKQLAVAVAGALATLVSVPALAQVTMSGNIDVSQTTMHVDNVKTSNFTSGIASTSKLIIQGTEDLGGGLKARFYTETGLGATTQRATGYNSTVAGTRDVTTEKDSTMIGDRGIYVGVMGSFGSLDMGRIPHITTGAAIGMGGVQNAFLSAVNAGAAHAGNNSDAVFTSQTEGRGNNSILYTTPNMNGFTGKVMHSMGGGLGDGSQGNRTSFSANFNKDAFTIEVMNSRRSAYDAGTQDLTGNTPAQTQGNAVYNAGSKISESGLGLKYDMKVAVFGVGYARQASTTAAGAVTTQKASGLGVTVPFGSWALSLGSASTSPATTASYSAYSMSAQYSLSKRTTGYFGTRRNNQASGKDGLNFFGVNHTF